jgi:hypothetical protein
MDDFQPYVYRTDDYGQTWTRLTDGSNGIPAGHPTRTVREDPDRKGLLYVGTEFGLFVSFDDGAHWQSLQLNLPHTPITDLIVHEKDLVVATQGRSFWVLDDLTPLHRLTPEVVEVAAKEPHLFKPRTTVRATGFRRAGRQSKYVTDGIGGAAVPWETAGDNPPSGAMIFYALPETPTTKVMLEVLDAEGRLVRSFSSEAPEENRLSSKPGLNRFVWDLRYPGVEGKVVQQQGPVAIPGMYKVRLTLGDWTETVSFELVKDPRVSTAQDEFVAQFALLSEIRDRRQHINDVVDTIRDVKKQILDTAARLEQAPGADEVRKRANALVERLTDVEARIILVPRGPIMGHAPRMIDGELQFLQSYVSSADARPTDGDVERFAELGAWLGERTQDIRTVLQQDVAQFSALIGRFGAGPIFIGMPTLR